MKPRRSGLDVDEVRLALRPIDVIAHFQITGCRHGGEWRTRNCASCGPRSRQDTVSINIVTGRWMDHAHGCAGDLFDAIAGYAGLDIRRDFPRVLELALVGE